MLKMQQLAEIHAQASSILAQHAGATGLAGESMGPTATSAAPVTTAGPKQTLQPIPLKSRNAGSTMLQKSGSTQKMPKTVDNLMAYS